MNKQVKYTYLGANQDVSQSKHQNTFYYDAEHIRIMASDRQTAGSIENEKGTELVITIPNITINQSASTITYGSVTESYTGGNEIDTQITAGDLPTSSTTQKIVGAVSTRTGIVLFTTDDLGMDCVWEIDNVIEDTPANTNYSLDLIYIRSLGFSSNDPIQAIFNYENDNIQKVYWVDGKAQIRFLNLKHESIEGNGLLLDIPSTSIDFVGTVDFSQPIVTDVVGGGSHTAGMIQYAYNLYRLNSSQSKLSPLSELVPLGKDGDNGGGEVNEVVGSTPIVQIDDIDQSYTNIKVYAIKYTSLNQLPEIGLIEERELSGSTLSVYDDGNVLESITLEEFLFLGSDPYIPRHIETKDNRMFLADITTNDFLLPEELDCRAYSFIAGGSYASVYDDPFLNTNGAVTGTRSNVSSLYILPTNHDAINLNYDVFKYQKDGATLGGEGKYIKYQLLPKTEGELSKPVDNYTFLKDNEIYRIGIVFFNRIGQQSLPQWIADFRAPQGNLEGNYNTLKVELKTEFYTLIDNYAYDSEDDRPVGYKIIRANRTFEDRTIITQGMLNGMMINVSKDGLSDPILGKNLSRSAAKQARRAASDANVKYPNFLCRYFGASVLADGFLPLQPNEHLLNMQFSNNNPDSYSTGSPYLIVNRGTEVQYEDEGARVADSIQYTTMQQLYSPDVFFFNLPFTSGLKTKIRGLATYTDKRVWYQGRNVNTQTQDQEGKSSNATHTYQPGTGGTITEINGNQDNFQDRGLIYNPNSGGNEERTAFTQWYREMAGFSAAQNDEAEFPIYGTPELTDRGQGRTVYNRNPKYEYQNTLEGFRSDGDDSFSSSSGGFQQPITSINTWGARCLTLVHGDENDKSYFRPSLESMFTTANTPLSKGSLIAEIIKDSTQLYVGNIYGGFSYEDKKRTDYIPIGSYNDLTTTSVEIDNAGDTYVQEFRFLRMGKTETEIYAYNVNQITEIVSVRLETNVDLKNRHDVSNSAWDSDFQPRFDEYHLYNTVYSQQPTLLSTSDLDFTFRRLEKFDTRIQSTKLKIPNETIDSWTDILSNEIMDLNGKFGPINNIIEFKDNLFAFQDEAIAAISINPRIQVQGNDGVGIELGTGGILYDFNYLTTKSGSLNKWGMTATKSGIYYYDALNKGIGRVPDAVGPLLSDTKGLHTFFNNNYNYTSIEQDNPVLGAGAVVGYDNYNNDIFFTLLQGDDSFTWVFNELQNEFVDRKLYLPTKYIYKGEKLISVSNDSTQGYEHYAGDYNNYHGTQQASTITIQVNPESDYDKVFNNIFYNSEVYLNDLDQPEKTLTHITAYNEYQNSGRIALVSGRNSNLRRKFREWKANIPRDGRNRIRNPWIFLKLEYDANDNTRLVLHDIIISYTV